jgi:tetratricopeptide (TPR) repeat protein
MDCERCEALLIEAALGRIGSVSEDDAVVLRHHLEHCERCRTEFDNLKALLAAARTASPELSPESLHATHQAVMRAVSRRRRTVKILKLGAGLLGAAAAACLVLALSSGIDRGNTPAAAQATPPTRIVTVALSEHSALASTMTPEPAKPSLDPDFIRNVEAQTEPKAAFALIQDCFGQLKDRQGEGDFNALITLCDTIITRWPDSREALEARKLISRCYAELLDPEAARLAYLAYADAAGARAKARLLAKGGDAEAAGAEADRVSGKAILDEAQGLFSRNLSMESLAYCDVLISRYPGTETERTAKYVVGLYARQGNSPVEAARTFQEILDKAPADSPIAMLARTHLPEALVNSGRPDEAVGVWLKYSQLATDSEEQARGYYHAARILTEKGKEHYAEALALYKKVQTDYAGSSYTGRSSNWARSLHTKLTGLDTKLDPIDTDEMLKKLGDFYKEEIPEIKKILGDQEPIDVLSM